MNLKTLTLTLLICCVGTLTNAQSFSYYDYNFNWSLVNRVNYDKEKVVQEKIETRTIQINKFGKKGGLKKVIVSQRYFYNQAGQIIREENYTENSKLQTSHNYTMDEKGRVIKKETFSGNRTQPSYTWHISYYNDTLISEVQTYTKKGKPAWGYRYFYNSDNQFSEQRRYGKGKLTSRIEFDYYGDKSKKEVRYYKDSTKLERTFRYDCGIENSLLSQKQKDTVTQCRHQVELTDGTVQVVYETRDEKGRIVRAVNEYNKEQKWSTYKLYDEKNNLKYNHKREAISEGNQKVTYMNYKKGKLKSTRIYIETVDSFGFFGQTKMEEEKVAYECHSSYTFFAKKNN